MRATRSVGPHSMSAGIHAGRCETETLPSVHPFGTRT
jgi:hypothetical protein